jgi:hypothetical protein
MKALLRDCASIADGGSLHVIRVQTWLLEASTHTTNASQTTSYISRDTLRMLQVILSIYKDSRYGSSLWVVRPEPPSICQVPNPCTVHCLAAKMLA